MAFSLHSIRKYQKPIIVALAVFLMIAWFLGGMLRDLLEQGQSGLDQPVIIIRDHEITREEFGDFSSRWTKVDYRLAQQPWAELEQALKDNLALVYEARRAGLAVSDEELRAGLAKQWRILRRADLEIVRGKTEDFEKVAEIKPEDVEAYYNAHKKDYTEGLETARGDIEKKLAAEKAAGLLEAALKKAKRKTLAAGDGEDEALQKAADDAGLEFEQRAIFDSKFNIEAALGDIADDPSIAGKLFNIKAGSFRGPFDTDDGKLIFRITALGPGLDADGYYHNTVEGWTDEGFRAREDDRIGFGQLVRRAYRDLTVQDLEDTIRERLLVNRYIGMLTNTFATPTDTARQDHYRQNEKVRVDYLAFNGSDLMKTVEVSDEEIEELYNKYKDRVASATNLGYKQLPMVSIEYIIATKPKSYLATYTEEQLRKFYDENKDKYLIDPDAETPEHRTFEDAREQVKNDLIDNDFSKKAVDLQRASEALDARLQDYITAQEDNKANEGGAGPPDLRMEETAKRFGLNYGKTNPFRQSSYDWKRKDLRDLREGWKEVTDNAFSNEYLADEELRTAGPSAIRNRVISRIFKTRSGTEFLFRVLERIPAKVVPFDELTSDVLDTVRKDKQTQAALELAQGEASKMAPRIRIDAFNALAEELEIKPAVTEEFEAGKLPKSVEKGSAVAVAAGELKAGQMSGLIDAGDSLNVVLCQAGEEENKLVWKTLSFGLETEIKGPELNDAELADHLAKDFEAYAADLPLKGTATIRYVAAKYEDVEKSISPTDDEVKEFYEKNKVDKFADKTLEECRGDIVAAIRTEKAPAKADKLIKEALAKAREDDTDIEEVAEDNDALTTERVYGIKLDDVTDKEFIGKADDLARTILATEKGDIAEPLKTEDGVFFFRVEFKNLGGNKALWEEMSDEGKDKVKEDLLEKRSALPAIDRAKLQFGRYITRAFEEAPDRYLIRVSQKLDTQIKEALKLDTQLSLKNRTGFSRDTVNELLAIEPNTLSDAIKDGRKSYVFHVRSVQPLQLAKIEYIKVNPADVQLDIPEEDSEEYYEKAHEKALAVAERIHAAAKDEGSLGAALKALGDKLEAKMLIAVETPYFAEGTEFVGGLRKLSLLKKVFQLKPGELADIEDTGTGIYVARLIDLVKEAKEAKVEFVRVYRTSFITAEVTAEEAVVKAEEAMAAFREEAVKKGSLEEALETLKKAMPEGDKEVSVESLDDFTRQVDPPPILANKPELLDAIFATEPGGFTPVVKVVDGYYVVHVEDVRASRSVTVDWTSIGGRNLFADPLGLSDEHLKKYYDENKEEKYRRDKQWEITYLLARDEAFNEKAEEEVTDEALAEYFEDHKEDYQYPDAEGQTVTPEFDNVKDKVKKAFVDDKSSVLATEALKAARAEMAAEDAGLQALADEHGLEYKDLGLVSEEQFGGQYAFNSIKSFKDSIFSMEKGDFSEIKTKKPDYYVFKIADVKESYIPELDEIESNVRRDADGEQQTERALALAGTLKEEIAKAMADGKTFEEAVAGASVEFVSSTQPSHDTTRNAFTRRIYRGGWYQGGRTGLSGNRPKFVETAFTLEPGEVSDPVVEENEKKTAYLLLLREQTIPEEADEDEVEKSRQSMDSVSASELTSDTIKRVQNQAAFILLR